MARRKSKKSKNVYDEMFLSNIKKQQKPKNIWDVVFYERFYGGNKS